MNPTIEELKDTYKISREQFEESFKEAREILDMYHNRQWTAKQARELEQRGQPAETFNVVKLFAHALVGYFEQVANDIQAIPNHANYAIPALLLNDTISYVLDSNDFDSIGTKLKLDLFTCGMAALYKRVEPTGKVDAFGRKLHRIELERVNPMQIAPDPNSRREDYSDARFIHRFKWICEAEVKENWPNADLGKLQDKYDYLDADGESDYYVEFTSSSTGYYKYRENYLIVHSITRKGEEYWETIWCDEIILEQKKISNLKIKWPYRITKCFTSDRVEFYGPFREVSEAQKAINQALIQIQLLVNTSKVFYNEDDIPEDMTHEQFVESFNRVNSVIPMQDIMGINLVDTSRDVQKQILIIDRKLDQIKQVLGVNDSFLGQAYASDSGRKVQLQKASSFSQLTVLTKIVQQMYKLIGYDVAALIQQYMYANQLIRIADQVIGDRYFLINQPMLQPTGQVDPQTGQPVMMPIWDEELDPETGEPMRDDSGAIIMTPLNDPDTDIKFADVDIRIQSMPYNNAEERNQLLFETFMNGPLGMSVAQVNPAGYYQIASAQIMEYGTKHSPMIAQILQQTAQMIMGGQVAPQMAVPGMAQEVLGGAMGGSNANPVNGPSSRPENSVTTMVPTRFNNGEKNA